MKTLFCALLVASTLTAAAQTQQAQVPSEPYDFVLAKMAASEGKYDEALSRLDKVIEKTPDDPTLLYERAMILIDAGKSDRGEAELRKVVVANPGFYEAQRILGRLLLERSQNDRAKMEEAMEHLRAAYKANPNDLATGVAVSQLLVSFGRTADAEKLLAELLERAPDQRAINYNYAQVLTKLGRGNESKQYLERAVLLDPTFGPAVLQLIDIYQRENEWQKAAEVLEPLVGEDPMNLDLQRQQAYFWLRSGNAEKARASFKALSEADPKDTRAQFYLAESLSDLDQYAEADKIYRKLLEQTPDDTDVLSSFGLSQVGQRQYEEAAKTFRHLLELKDVPDNLQALARTQLALIALQKNDVDTALAMSKDVLVFRDKPNAQAVNIALDVLRRQKKWAEAVALLQPLVDKFASDPFVNARYVEMLVRAGEPQKAKEAASTQVKFGVRNAISSAEAFIAAGDFKQAIVLMNEALRAKPDEIDLRFELGSAYERGGDSKAAEKIFLEILGKNPEHAATLNYLGYMWAESNVNLERAAEMLNQAVTQEPHNGAYIDSLGWVYFRQGKLDLAEKYLTDATRLLPRDATVHEHLGDVFAKRGDLTRALSAYRAALDLEPEKKDEEKLRVKIAELEKQAQSAQR
ncbi:MAG TPA: tetratricopeptide repeat protein [Thermoanaerobaculia bacterium]|nr:tetratricopeptide repeat protein [Thermoanaerobaculia bacterium]